VAKGVATLMDTVFLLLIASVAAAILVSAAANYGKNLRAQAGDLLTEYYVRQIIRVVSTATLNRPGCDTPDYLLAYLKEKVMYNEVADTATLKNLGDVLEDVMKPLGDAYDYAFYLQVGTGADANTYVFMWRHKSSGLEASCYSTTRKGLVQWRDALVSEHVSPRAYSVPTRLRIIDEKSGTSSYITGYMGVFLWPSGAKIDTFSLGTNKC